MVYTTNMDEKQLTIEQVEIIMGWSYPTALKFASRFGEMRGGKWHVPSNLVGGKIAELDVSVTGMKRRFTQETAAPK